MDNPRKIIIVVIALLVGLLHFIVGPDYQGPLRDFVKGYLIDILLPFSLFLLMGLVRNSVIKNTYFRIVFIILTGISVEVLQFYGVQIFGNTADVYDLLAYASGIMMAVIFERVVLSKLPNPKR